jgi:hypothetical protein
MTEAELVPVFLLVAALQAKHFFCDGPLQTHAMVISKSVYGQTMGVLHSFLHGLGTLVVLFAFQFSLSVALGLAFADFVIHYHVDFCKENIVKRAGWTTQNSKFWWALSADQMLHQFTYLGVACAAFIIALRHH